jgi:hypothetical protein
MSNEHPPPPLFDEASDARPPAQDASTLKGVVESERLRSRHRDRFSRERVHPIQYDVNRLTNFVCDRRTRQPGALDTVRRVMKSVDTEALRVLVQIASERGSRSRSMRRCCSRVLSYCDVIEAALALRSPEKLNDQR